MPSLKAVRARIRSVKNIQQITKAMKMVAAAKLRRAQEAILAARPFAEKLDEVLAGVAERTDMASHPLLAKREIRKVELVVMTSDRGQCGGFNSNILRRAERFVFEGRDQYTQIELSTIGRKGHDYFRKRKARLRHDYAGLFADLTYPKAQAIADELAKFFVAADLDAVFLLYNEFVSVATQKVRLVQLLPLPAPEPAATRSAPIEYLYEPSRKAVLEKLLPRALGVKIFRALLESHAAEFAARMTAMENASKNAAEMIDKLTLLANRTRQAAITKELMEIVSGAEALK
jgi:F-type H+-transporting ATPase subunit gamma